LNPVSKNHLESGVGIPLPQVILVPQVFTMVNTTAAFDKARKKSTTTMNIFISKWLK
jgi:hypothetical protein